MKTKFIAAALALSSAAIFGSPATAQDDAFSKAREAYLQADYVEAVKWFRLLADQGEALAQAQLGYMYDMGEGVPENDAEAVKWFRLAAEQGYVPAQHSLGAMYHSGQGVPKNYAEAVKWYRLAAEQGDAGAQTSLGSMYALGRAVPEDYIQAYMWLNLAAAQGDELAVRGKDLVRNQMTPEQIADAQRLSAAWKPVGKR